MAVRTRIVATPLAYEILSDPLQKSELDRVFGTALSLASSPPDHRRHQFWEFLDEKWQGTLSLDLGWSKDPSADEMVLTICTHTDAPTLQSPAKNCIPVHLV